MPNPNDPRRRFIARLDDIKLGPPKEPRYVDLRKEAADRHQAALTEQFESRCQGWEEQPQTFATPEAIVAFIREKITAGRPEEAACLLYHLGKARVLREGILKGVSLSGVGLPNLLLLDADLRQADLAAVNLERGVFINPNFGEANLSGVNLAEAVVRSGQFRKSYLDRVNLRLGWIEGDLSETSMEQADLSGAIVTGSLVGASLRGANLENCWLCYSDVRGVDFTGANLKGMVHSVVHLDETTLLPDGTPHKSLTDDFSRFTDAGRRDFWSPDSAAFE